MSAAHALVSEPEFDDLTRLAATVCRAPAALLTLACDAGRTLRSHFGTPADHPSPPDDPGPVVPLALPDGTPVGALRVFGVAAADLSAAEHDALHAVARQAVTVHTLRRRLSEQAKDHETFRVLFEQSSDAHLIFDERDGILDCNPAAVAMLRCRDKSEVLALHPAALSPEYQPDGRRSLEKCVEMDATARRTGCHRFDWTHRRADGEEFPCEVTLTPVTLHGRGVLLVVWHDLTPRVRAEDELRASEERFRRVVDELAEGLVLVDYHTRRVVRANRAVRDLLGYTAAEFAALTQYDFVAHDRADVDERMAAVVRDGRRDLGFRKYRRKDGTLVDVSVNVSRLDLGGRTLLSLSVRDMTPVKAAEGALRASKERFRAFMDHSPAVAYIVDEDGRLLYLNEPMRRAFRVTDADWLGKTEAERFPPEVARRMREVNRQVLDSGRPLEVTESTPGEGGGERVWRSYKFPIVDPSGRRLLGGMAVDITAERRAEAERQAGVERQRRQQAALLELLRADLTAGEQMTWRVLELVARTLEVDRASVWHLTPRGDALRCAALYERGRNRYSSGMLLTAASHPDYFRALESDEVIAAEDARTDPRTAGFRDPYLLPLDIHSLLDVPLRHNGELGGVLCLEQVGSPRGWPPDERVFALGAASILTLAAEQSARRQAEDALRESELRFRGMVENLPEGVVIIHPDTLAVLRTNPAFLDLLGYTAAEAARLTKPDFALHPAAEARERMARVLAAGRTDLGMCDYRRKDGRVVAVSVSGSRLTLEERAVVCLVVRDMTPVMTAQAALRASEERFRAAMAGSMDAVFFLAAERDAGGRVADFVFTDLNPRGADLLGRPAEGVIGRRLCELLPVNRTAGFFDKYVAVADTGRPLEEEFPIAAGGIAAGWLHHQVVRVGDGVVITTRDVTDRKRAELALRASEERFELAVRGSQDGLWDWDLRTGAVYFSPRWKGMLGYAEGEVGGTADEWRRLLHPADRPKAEAALADYLTGRARQYGLEVRMLHKDGEYRWIYTRGQAQFAPDGTPARMAGSHTDITPLKRAEQELRRSQWELERANAQLQELATTDGLTGVRNRAAFDRRLADEVDRAGRYGLRLSVVLLDVDHFKAFNDTFGHPAGDAVLRGVGAILREAVRGTDFVARYGGEEFVVLLPETDEAGAVAMAERCRLAVAAADWGCRPITVSVEVATLTPDTPDATALVSEADRALYQSKRGGRNRVNHSSQTVPAAATRRG